MKVVTNLVGISDHARTLEWPNDWPVPAVGDSISLDPYTLAVRTVIWYPEGEGDDHEPFVYVVIGLPRR